MGLEKSYTLNELKGVQGWINYIVAIVIFEGTLRNYQPKPVVVQTEQEEKGLPPPTKRRKINSHPDVVAAALQVEQEKKKLEAVKKATAKKIRNQEVAATVDAELKKNETAVFAPPHPVHTSNTAQSVATIPPKTMNRVIGAPGTENSNTALSVASVPPRTVNRVVGAPGTENKVPTKRGPTRKTSGSAAIIPRTLIF